MWLAPEQAFPDTNKGQDLVWHISERTDIWAITHLIWHLVHANKGPDELREMRSMVQSLLACKEIDGVQLEMPPRSVFAREKKIPDLLVDSLVLDPFARPSLEDLVDRVQRRLKKFDKKAGLDISAPPTEAPVDFALKPMKRNREFEIGEQFPSAAKRRKTKDEEAQAQYDDAFEEPAANSIVDDDARLTTLRDVFAVMHLQNSYDETLIRDYSLLQHLLYELTFDHISESKAVRKAIRRVPGKKVVVVKILSAYEKVSRGKSRQVDSATPGAQEVKAAFQEMKHAMRWGLQLVELGKWQVFYPELVKKPFHGAVALYVLSELRNADDGDTEFENMKRCQ